MNPSNPGQNKGQPSLSELLSGYLQRQTQDHAEGLASVAVSGEVEPYEAGPVQPIDARPAWEEAVAVITQMKAPGGKTWKAPPAWPQLVAAHAPAFDLALSLGNFPQLVRNLGPLLSAKDLAELRTRTHHQTPEAPALTSWAEQVSASGEFPTLILVVGALRLARQFDLAAHLIARHDGAVPASWRPVWDNEKAALAWHRGEVEDARRLWRAQPESAPVLFNRGMAALFTNQPAEARDLLSRAVAQLPEASAWHHLARLYLTLAEARA